MNPISVKPVEIEPKFLLPLKEYKELVKQELLTTAAEDNLDITEDKLSNIMQSEVNYYMEIQKKISHNELLKTIWTDPDKGQFLEHMARRVSDEAYNYYVYVGEPVTISVLNRKLGKQWRNKFPHFSFVNFVRILCENSYIKFELFGTKTGTNLLVPSLLRQLEFDSSFVFDTCTTEKNYPPLTAELRLAYL